MTEVNDDATTPLIDKSQKEKRQQNISYWNVFRFADHFDWILFATGTVGSAVAGLGQPLLFLVLGKISTLLSTHERYQSCGFQYSICFKDNLTRLNESQWNKTLGPQLLSFEASGFQMVYAFLVIAAAMFVAGFVQMLAWSLLAVRQTKMIRVKYFRSILRQEIKFHDITSSSELISTLGRDITVVETTIATRTSRFLQHAFMTIAGLVIGFYYSWQLALLALAFTPVMFLAFMVLFKVMDGLKKKELEAYAKAGAVAEEAISSIKTVAAFGCQDREVERYAGNFQDVKKIGIYRSLTVGAVLGLSSLSMFSMFGLSIWFGMTLVFEGQFAVGDIIISVFNVITAVYGARLAFTDLEYIVEAHSAVDRLYAIIDRIPVIDVFSETGEIPDYQNIEIKFDNVTFSFPSRPDVKVLKGLKFTVGSRKKLALVGQIGCGKSTVVQLIQRFYDVEHGDVKIGGKNVKSLRLKQLRRMIGFVPQEPVFFATTIADNIRWGRDDITDDEIYEAAKQANTFNFIMKLPEKFDTLLEENGDQLSAGQKQRIAIARAIVRNPKILLVDEATSSLNIYNEAEIQKALDKASVGRTTIVATHRLSTIRDADKIVVIAGGRVKEQGTHEDLLQIPDGFYKKLVQVQAGHQADRSKAERFQLDLHDTYSPDDEQQTLTEHYRQSSKGTTVRDELQDKREEPDGDKDELPTFSFRRFLRMNKQEWPYLLGGCIFAFIAGAIDPLQTVLWSFIFQLTAIAKINEQELDASFIGLSYFIFGLVCFLALLAEGACFGKSGMELVARMRVLTFRAILRQEMNFFDKDAHSTETLCRRLEVDGARVHGCTGARLGFILSNLATLLSWIVISFAYGWQLSLLTTGLFPILVLAEYFSTKVITRASILETIEFDKAGHLASEAISNIRTVAALSNEENVVELYQTKLNEAGRNSLKKSIVIGASYGFSQAAGLFVFAAVFALAILLLKNGQLEFNKVFLVMFSLIFGYTLIGQIPSFIPDYAEARLSATRLLALLDRVPSIDAYSPEGKSPEHCRGEIIFKSVSFRYPCQPSAIVLREINICVKPGQTLALVGESGCEKTAIADLIERFYDPEKGQVLLDGIDIKQLNVSWLRMQLSFVSQEPEFFDRSIRENILFGESEAQATDGQLEEVSRKSNVNQFVSALPENLQTNFGQKGEKFSEGQKQRIAIARALIRNSKILLLDEAASAVDSENEKAVQEALDAARSGRTSIVIARRLATLKNADQIVVIDSGSIVEAGTHKELIENKGQYYSLVSSQFFVDGKTTTHS
ncbi:ATP-dependent translocase ABCB1-like [Clavelina lepadiformis]|uniref:ATP-dependent translocase ABCB1-like n=1 Tax=Clavelina lepadiformis TaxID=159417 RepID=UPI004041DADD